MLKEEAEKHLRKVAQSLAEIEVELRQAQKPLDKVDEILRALGDLEEAMGLGTYVFDWDLFENTWVSEALGRAKAPGA